jgi:hypothetical protein
MIYLATHTQACIKEFSAKQDCQHVIELVNTESVMIGINNHFTVIYSSEQRANVVE